MLTIAESAVLRLKVLTRESKIVTMWMVDVHLTTLQYIQPPNYYIVHLKLIRCYMSALSIMLGGEKYCNNISVLKKIDPPPRQLPPWCVASGQAWQRPEDGWGLSPGSGAPASLARGRGACGLQNHQQATLCLSGAPPIPPEGHATCRLA